MVSAGRLTPEHGVDRPRSARRPAPRCRRSRKLRLRRGPAGRRARSRRHSSSRTSTSAARSAMSTGRVPWLALSSSAGQCEDEAEARIWRRLLGTAAQRVGALGLSPIRAPSTPGKGSVRNSVSSLAGAAAQGGRVGAQHLARRRVAAGARHRRRGASEASVGRRDLAEGRVGHDAAGLRLGRQAGTLRKSPPVVAPLRTSTLPPISEAETSRGAPRAAWLDLLGGPARAACSVPWEWPISTTPRPRLWCRQVLAPGRRARRRRRCARRLGR